MDQDHHDEKSPEYGGLTAPRSRRKFLRNVGMTAAATAAVVGVTDAMGMMPAFGAARGSGRPGSWAGDIPISELPPNVAKKMREIRARQGSDPGYLCCVPAHGDCGGPCTPASVWCHACCDSNGHCGFFCVYGESTSPCLH
jgi:hypothetical protein